ncbi:MAG: ABC transporter ATP-binding protein [Lentisphaerae bacterium]|nr:ABC transporter ATP-binding protein [Lentisphaerota bacterium]
MSAFVSFKNVTKRFETLTAVDNVSLDIEKGEVFSLLGPSGCGKTTLLRMLAGLETPDSGRVILDGQDITNLPPNLRRVHTIFQNYALFPHMTVWDNIAFPLRVARYPKQEIARRVKGILELIRLGDHDYKYPSQISGGQKQRVAIARALVDQPQVLLLDEPLAALDLKLRQHMLLELDLIHDKVGITFLYVTHDQGEAMSLSDRIAVMNNGRIEQIDPPAKIYEAPRSSFVAAFIGDTNFLQGHVTSISHDYCNLAIVGLTSSVKSYNDKAIRAGSMVHLSVRPEKIHIAKTPPEFKDDLADKINLFSGVVEDIVYQGSHTKYWVKVGAHRIVTNMPHMRFQLDQEEITWGDSVALWWHADDAFMLEQFHATDAALIDPPAQYEEDVEIFRGTGNEP